METRTIAFHTPRTKHGRQACTWKRCDSLFTLHPHTHPTLQFAKDSCVDSSKNKWVRDFVKVHIAHWQTRTISIPQAESVTQIVVLYAERVALWSSIYDDTSFRRYTESGNIDWKLKYVQYQMVLNFPGVVFALAAARDHISSRFSRWRCASQVQTQESYSWCFSRARIAAGTGVAPMDGGGPGWRVCCRVRKEFHIHHRQGRGAFVSAIPARTLPRHVRALHPRTVAVAVDRQHRTRFLLDTESLRGWDLSMYHLDNVPNIPKFHPHDPKDLPYLLVRLDKPMWHKW